MERNVVKRLRCALLLASFGAAGCYDMEKLDEGSTSSYLLIDDFEDAAEDSRGLASAAQFHGSWRGVPFNSDGDPQDGVDFVAGDTSDYALRGRFTFADPGNIDFTGVNVGVSDARPLLDARAFEAIHFSIRFDFGGTPFPGITHFYVQLGCDSAPPLGNELGPFWVHEGIDDVSNDWKTMRIFIENFHEPAEQGARIDGGAAACLPRIDSVRFTVATHLTAQDNPVTGTLYLDDVFFE
jgi:hypothetical protein